MGLTWKVQSKRINETQVELQVGRTRAAARGGARDVVGLADVGFGISQCIPVVIALLAARPGQLVYLEEPEIHLHPYAQYQMARLLAAAAGRGVRVVVETHSSLLLRGLQVLIAEGDLPHSRVKLHWFSRTATGSTVVSSANVDRQGAFGKWPVDFDRITVEAEND